MFRFTTAFVSAGLALTIVLLGGCLAAPIDSDSGLEPIAFDKADGPIRPFGTFSGEGGDLSLLVLAEDRTYEADSQTGRFRWAGSHGRTYVILYDGDGNDRWRSYEYMLGEDSIALRRTRTLDWFELQAAPFVDDDLCLDIEGGIDACVGLNGLSLSECVAMFEDGEWMAEITACCELSSEYYFCPLPTEPEVEVDEDRCEELEGGVDACVGLEGLPVAECVEALDDGESFDELTACCDLSSVYLFCPLNG